MLCQQANDHTDIFINQQIECYLNNTVNLRPLTPHICHVIPTKWRSYRGHRFCDVISPYVYAVSQRKTPTLYFSKNNSVKNQPISLTFDVRNPEEISRRWFCSCPPQADMLPLYLVKCKSHASDRSHIASLRKVDVAEIASRLATQRLKYQTNSITGIFKMSH